MSWGAVAGAGITLAGSMLGSKKKKGPTQTTSNEMPPWLASASQNAIGRADELSRRAYTPFNGQRVAGLSGQEQQAGELASAFGQRTAARMAPGYTPDISAFENPYLDRVLNARKRAIGEEFGRQSADLAKRQSAMDAFRTGRSDLARSRLNDSRLRALDEAEGEARAGAFESAMGNYFKNEAAGQGAFETAQRGLQSSGLAERSIRQANNDFDYGSYLERRDWDVNNLTPLLNAIGAARGGSTSSTSTSYPDKDKWGAVGGLLGQAVSTLWGGTGGTSAFNDPGDAAGTGINPYAVK